MVQKLFERSLDANGNRWKNFKVQANCGRGATRINSWPSSIFNLHK